MADEEAVEESAPSGGGKVIRSGGAVSASSGHAVVVAQPAPLAQPLLPKVSRRGVVIGAFWGGMAAMLGGIVVTILNMLWPRGVTGFGSDIFVGTVDEFPEGSPQQNVDARAWIVKLNADQAQRNGAQQGAMLALYQKCPHLGCTVPWNGNFTFEDPRTTESYAGWFRCPCHGSTYTPAGVRVFGPAPRSMDTMGLVIEDGNVTVQTGNITPGGEDNGSRAVLPG
jgi:cytochrome b6-f complex iron-sulfur subunit